MAELDNPDGAEVSSAEPDGPAADDTAVDGPAADGPAADGPAADPESAVRRAPVRTAPIRRGRKRSSTPGADDPGSDEEHSPSDVSPDDVSDGDVTGGAVMAGQGLSYRERRRVHGDTVQRRRGGRIVGSARREPTVRYRGATASGAKRIALTLICGIAILACVAASVVFAVGIHRYDATNDLRTEYSDFAQQMIVNLTTLNPQNVDGALKTLEDKTSGRAKQQKQDSKKQAVGLVKDENLTTETTILSDAVTAAEPDEGTVIVVYGWQMASPDPKEDTIVQTFRWRVQMTRINGDLKMTNFEWVT